MTKVEWFFKYKQIPAYVHEQYKEEMSNYNTELKPREHMILNQEIKKYDVAPAKDKKRVRREVITSHYPKAMINFFDNLEDIMRDIWNDIYGDWNLPFHPDMLD